MRSQYEVGSLLGKGNFAKVYEATNFKSKQKFALKTIEKKILSKNKRNFVSHRKFFINLIKKFSLPYCKKSLYWEE